MTEHFYDQLQQLGGTEPLTDRQRLEALVKPLLSWYRGNARPLPWREEPSPYGVWISEIMLQQTRVEAVKPYYERFMRELPGVKDLAAVPEERLMKLWEGLGYYSRARNLKKAAQVVMEQYGGKLPGDFSLLLKLPGIGSYTAGAIASIAFGIPVPAVDGNVLRVLARLLAYREDIRKPSAKTEMEKLLPGVIPEGDAGAFNQALIEVGAIVCLPGGEPRCAGCPLSSLCLTRERGLWREIPFRSPLKKRKIQELTVCLILRGDEAAVRRRPETGLLAALYELPNVPGRPKEEELLGQLNILPGQVAEMAPLPESRHIFSHVEWHMAGYFIRLKDGAEAGKDCLFVERRRIRDEYALPAAFGAYSRLI